MKITEKNSELKEIVKDMRDVGFEREAQRYLIEKRTRQENYALSSFYLMLAPSFVYIISTTSSTTKEFLENSIQEHPYALLSYVLFGFINLFFSGYRFKHIEKYIRLIHETADIERQRLKLDCAAINSKFAHHTLDELIRRFP